MKDQPLPDIDLLAYSAVHVAYEVDMFFGMAEILSRRGVIAAPSAEEAERLAKLIVEGFALHLRNLIEFLFYDVRYKTDVLAIHFSESWKDSGRKMSDTLKTALNRAHKQLAHLTVDRLTLEGWNVEGLSAEIRGLLRSFVEGARKEALSPRVAAVIR